MHQSVPNHLDPKPKTLILIWDTGGSAGLTPFCSDFIDYVECEIDVCDVTKVNKVIGIGTTLHKFVDATGSNIYLPCVSYHLPTTDVRLFSPQVYHQIYGGDSIVNGDKVVMRIRDDRGPIKIPIPIVVWNSFVSQNIKKKISRNFRSALIVTGINAALDYFADNIIRSSSTSFRMQGIFTNFPGVGGPVNENLWPRRNCFFGIGDLVWACSAFKQ